jgi:hypothetical protein
MMGRSFAAKQVLVCPMILPTLDVIVDYEKFPCSKP